MSPSERARMAILDTTLRRLDEAEKSALWELKKAGFAVRDIAGARKVQAKYREAARLHAAAIERMNEITSGRKTA